MIDQNPEAAVKTATNVIAAAGVASPWWLPVIEDLSDHAALWMPILGVVWLLVQIVRAIVKWGS